MLQNATFELQEFIEVKGNDAGDNWIWMQSTIAKLRKTLNAQFTLWDSELAELEEVEKRIDKELKQ